MPRHSAAERMPAHKDEPKEAAAKKQPKTVTETDEEAVALIEEGQKFLDAQERAAAEEAEARRLAEARESIEEAEVLSVDDRIAMKIGRETLKARADEQERSVFNMDQDAFRKAAIKPKVSLLSWIKGWLGRE